MPLPPPLKDLAKQALPLSALRWAQRALSPERALDLAAELPSGVRVSVRDRSDWVVYTDVFVGGEYDGPIAAALEGRPEDRPLRVLDLGANVGFFTLRLFDRARERGVPDGAVRATLVEGSPRTVRALRERVLDSGVPAASVSVVHGLVGRRSGTGHLTQNRSSGMSNVLSGRALAAPVPFVDLDRVAGDGPIDLVKCDVEGAEEMFAEAYGGLLGRTERAVFEFHPLLCDVGRCKRLIAEAGLVHETVLRRHPEFEVTSFHR